MPTLEFWYDFASTYSYLSAMRIEELGRGKGVEIVWRPFLLGPIFKAQGWDTSPFNLYPTKGQYMIRDLERIAGARSLPFQLNTDFFPGNSLMAARIGIVAAEEGWAPDFTRAVYRLEFGEGRNIADQATLAAAVEAAGRDAQPVFATIQEQRVKDALRAQTERAMALGIFGAPTFLTPDGELFWGDDRLDQAMQWSLRS